MADRILSIFEIKKFDFWIYKNEMKKNVEIFCTIVKIIIYNEKILNHTYGDFDGIFSIKIEKMKKFPLI